MSYTSFYMSLTRFYMLRTSFYMSDTSFYMSRTSFYMSRTNIIIYLGCIYCQTRSKNMIWGVYFWLVGADFCNSCHANTRFLIFCSTCFLLSFA